MNPPEASSMTLRLSTRRSALAVLVFHVAPGCAHAPAPAAHPPVVVLEDVRVFDGEALVARFRFRPTRR
jgi:hypothetical protein